MSMEGVVPSAEAAYEQAFAAYWHDVFRFALAWTNDWAAAEDLAQDAYLRLWSSRSRLDWDRPVLPWLLTTSRRLATDRYRTLRRRLLKGPERGSMHVDDDIANKWLDVQAAMRGLSPRERTALILTAVEGWSYADAATVVGASPGALRAAVSRAREKLEDETT
jgi:RNA polymerase sigma-70 factor (ECF subfamily)